jgi:hypothetical protein
MNLTLGPFLSTAQPCLAHFKQVLPLSLVLEWSTPERAYRIQLFRRMSSTTPARVRLDQIVFLREELPCDLECLHYQVHETADGDFLPIDSLLAALYRSHNVARPIFQLLTELASVLPLHHPVTNPITARNLLTAEAEALGFRLNAVYQEPRRILVQFGWQPASGSPRFHVCIAAFHLNTSGNSDRGTWVDERDPGVSKILAIQLHRECPGDPARLLTFSGMDLLRASLFRQLHLGSIKTASI